MAAGICCKKRDETGVVPLRKFVAVIFLLVLIRMGVPQWVEILLFGGVITMLASFSSRWSEPVLGNKFIVGLAKADMVIYLTHPGIAFHLVMFCFGHNAWMMVLGSMVIGFAMWWVYGFVLTQISRISKR